ncbi:MAG TPA: hypothetical protein VM598_07355, partial [Bdellovibrionota bacterium]|nr:hypothetical protein [Bdellovibrionota bacterium]
ILSVKKEEVKQVDATHRVVTTGFDVSFIPLAEITSPVTGGIPEARLSSTELWFQLGKVLRKEFLTLDVAITHVSSGREILRRAIPVDKVTFQDGRMHTNASISLSDLGLREALVPGKYRLGLSVGIRATGVEGLLNPDALAGIRPATYQKDHVVTFDSPELNAQTVLNMVGGGIQDVKLTAQELSFTVGKLVARQYVSLDLKLARQRYLSGPLTISELTLWDPARDRELPRYLKLADQGARTRVTVSLAGIRLTEQVGKFVYVVGLRASLKKDQLSGLIEDSLLESAEDALHNSEYRELAPPAEQVLAMTSGGIEGIELSTSRAQFTLGKVVAPEALTVRFTLKKDGVFGDKLIFDGHLKLGEGSANTRVVDAGGGRSKLLVDLSRLPLEEAVQSGKKYVFKVGAALNRDTAESILTADEIYRAREAEAELKLKALQ